MENELTRLRTDAAKCRDLASTAMTPAAREILSSLADGYEERASSLETIGASRHHLRPAFRWSFDG